MTLSVCSVKFLYGLQPTAIHFWQDVYIRKPHESKVHWNQVTKAFYSNFFNKEVESYQCIPG